MYKPNCNGTCNSLAHYKGKWVRVQNALMWNLQLRPRRNYSSHRGKCWYASVSIRVYKKCASNGCIVYVRCIYASARKRISWYTMYVRIDYCYFYMCLVAGKLYRSEIMKSWWWEQLKLAIFCLPFANLHCHSWSSPYYITCSHVWHSNYIGDFT